MQRSVLILLLTLVTLAAAAQKAYTIKPVIKRQWMLSADYSEEINTPVDTSFSQYHHNRRTDRYSPFNAYLGNYGQPLYQLSFFDRVTDPDKFIYRYLYPFMHTAENALYMNTQTPFTEMIFSYAGPRQKAEQNFRVRHSQNFHKDLNFGLIFDVAYSLGQYTYQRTDNKTFEFNGSYTGEKYKAYFVADINNLTGYQNGGISDATQLPSFDTRDVEVNMGNLNNSKNIFRNRELLLVQKLVLNKPVQVVTDSTGKDITPKKFRMNGVLSHILLFEKDKASFYDEKPSGGFYDSVFISTRITYDTVAMRVLRNTVRFDFSTDETRKFRLGGGVGIRNDLYRFMQGVDTFTLKTGTPSDTAVWHRANNVLVGHLFNDIGNKFRWQASGELFLTGYRAGDFDIKGDITKEFSLRKGLASWVINGGVSSLTPSDWYQRWIGNNFRWSNSFGREFRLNAGTSFSYPAWRFLLKFNYGIIDNFTYFGANALPAQHSGALSVASLLVKKEFSAWKFHLANEVLIQETSNKNVVDLPLVTVRSAGFFEHNIHFKLTGGSFPTQLGAEVIYYTAYNGYGWMPSSGVYYQQQSTKTGNYPYLNAFLNVKIKRARVFLMLDHFNSGMSGYEYFMVPGHPMNARCFRYGFAWTFYD